MIKVISRIGNSFTKTPSIFCVIWKSKKAKFPKTQQTPDSPTYLDSRNIFDQLFDKEIVVTRVDPSSSKNWVVENLLLFSRDNIENWVDGIE